jgi:hypothetical protein
MALGIHWALKDLAPSAGRLSTCSKEGAERTRLGGIGRCFDIVSGLSQRILGGIQSSRIGADCSRLATFRITRCEC